MVSWAERLALLAVATAALVHPAPVRAGATTPLLGLTSATASVAGGGRTVALEGTYDYPNAVQVGYPLQIVVFQGTRFVRYPIAAPAVTGTSDTLADGRLSADELDRLLAAGAPAPAAVRLVTATAGSLRLALPAEFTAGPASAVLFTILPEGTVLSNPMDFVLP